MTREEEERADACVRISSARKKEESPSLYAINNRARGALSLEFAFGEKMEM